MTMRRPRGIALCLGATAAVVIALAGAGAVRPAAAFECPVAERPGPGVLGEDRAEQQKLSALLAGDDIENRIGVIVTDLRRAYPAVPRFELVNYLVGAYCPVVRRKPGLSDGERRAEVGQFAEMVFDLLAKSAY